MHLMKQSADDTGCTWYKLQSITMLQLMRQDALDDMVFRWHWLHMIYCIAGYIGGGLYLAILAVSIVTAKSKHRNCITAPFQEPGNIVNSRSLYEMCIHMRRNGSINHRYRFEGSLHWGIIIVKKDYYIILVWKML